MSSVTGRNSPTIVLRYACIALCLLVLWVQSSLGRSQNALVICMISVAVFMMMVNRLTNSADRGPRFLVLAFAAFTVSFSVLFANEINRFLLVRDAQPALIIVAAVSGIGGAYLAQKRTAV